MIYDVLIVGAGPIGCKTAELVSSQGFNVLVLEEHSKIGKPVQCAGLVSHRTLELGDVSKDVIVNQVEKAKLQTLTGFLEIGSESPVYVIDREKFDKELSEKAESEGAEIRKNSKFKKYKIEKESVTSITNKGKFKSKTLVGAGGPRSTVAKSAGLKLPENVLIGIQQTIRSEYDPDAVELYFDASPDFFGWVIPEDKKWARVGLASSKDPKRLFKRFVKENFGKPESKNKVGGLIRYGLIKRSVKERMLLVGDAASTVKPFSGGGIIFGLIGAKIASKACIGALRSNDFSEEFFRKNYEEKWKQKLGKEMRAQLALRKFFYSFHQYGVLISQKLVEKFLEGADPDFPITSTKNLPVSLNF